MFVFSTFVVAFDLFRIRATSESIQLLRYIAFVWSAIQTIDTLFDIFHIFGKQALFASPSLIAFMAIMLMHLRRKEAFRKERIELATARILSVIDSKSPIREVLAQIALITSGELKFRRVSAYIDAFCVGAVDGPGRTFIRVMENGYQKNTSQDALITFDGDRGKYMAEAISCQKTLVCKNPSQRAWFFVVPISKHACINLSDEGPPENEYQIFENEEILNRLLPGLRSLDSRLVNHALQQFGALERLRTYFGDGKRDCKIGSIFADINDYSVNTERYGVAFSEFISAIYFPALIKKVGNYAAPEFVRGDEIYLVSIKELLVSEITVEQAVVNTLIELVDFVTNDGAKLCLASGYNPVSLSIGLNLGTATIICDPIKVRTAGQVVNEAKRLQEAAGPGEILIKSGALDGISITQFELDVEVPILIKKNFILARRLRRLVAKQPAA
jgi:hypothetical protein